MPGLVPGIHAFPRAWLDVDGRDKPGHDARKQSSSNGAQRTEVKNRARRKPESQVHIGW